MHWKLIAKDHWRAGDYEITKVGQSYCLWFQGTLVTHSHVLADIKEEPCS